MTIHCRFLLILFFLLRGVFTSAQISGIVNTYTPVTGISCNTITVQSPAGFSTGDHVLLIQMKGATIDQTNTTAFGTVVNYGDCGHYEFGTIASISGSTILLQYNLLNTYTVSGSVQLIRVPHYTDVTVSGTLTAQSWNGSTGGVLVIDVAGILTLNAPIMASSTGFRGAFGCNNPGGFCGLGYTDYFYAVSSGNGAEKGEGITVAGINQDGGMGALANGGGGGNKHNSGGGGGGNGSGGGNGGKEATFCTGSDVGGRGGKQLDYTTGRIFLGGGGGSPDHNDGVGSPGTNGGGIIILRAATMIANGQFIESNGGDVTLVQNWIGDGAGGAGAGGTILLDVQTYTGSLTVNASGGYGGDQHASWGSCFGPGGGGGTGAFLLSGSTTPAALTVVLAPGAAGLDLFATSPCYQTSYGAMPGDPAPLVIHNLVLPEGNQSTGSVIPNLGPDIQACNVATTLDPGSIDSTYLWSTGETSPTIMINSPGQYWVTVTDFCGHPFSDTIQIVQVTAPQLVVTDLALCKGASGLLTPLPQNIFTSFQWSPAYGLSCTTCPNPVAAPATSSMYFVTATTPGGCISTDSVFVAVEENVPEGVLFTVTDADCVSKGTISFGAVTGGSDHVYFNINHQGLSTEVMYANLPIGTYVISVQNSLNNLCHYDTVAAISGELNALYIPNAFTPDDNSTNPKWGITGNCIATVECGIYNRWGELIAQINEPQGSWDGTYRGKPVPDGIYTYQVIVTFGSGEIYETTGSIAVLR